MTRAEAVDGYGLCGRGTVRGLKFSVDSEAMMCFVVSWKKMGWFCVVCSGSDRSCSFSGDSEVEEDDLRCFNKAFSAFVNCIMLAWLHVEGKGT